MLPRFHLPSHARGTAALVWLHSDFWADALRHEEYPCFGAAPAPLSRVGVTRSCAACRRASDTFPIPLVPGTRGDGICWIEIGGQKRGVEVALHRPDATRALMPTLRERLRDELATAVTKLGQFGRACGNFVQGAARACNGASEVCY